MYTAKVIYQTIIHAALAAMIFFYTSPSYSIVRLQHEATTGTGYNADELTSFLDSQMGRK